MELQVRRIAKKEAYTIGRLYIDREYFCDTLEDKVREFKVGKGTDININFSLWSSNMVIAEGQSGIDELNYNFRHSTLENLADHSSDGITRVFTIRASLLNVITADNIAYANNKGWTLTT